MLEDLIFVSAQPDVPYFHWQVKVYIYNFIKLGINPDKIHVLFGIIPNNGEPTKESLEIKKLGVNVHHYLDDRDKKNYIPSVKPFLIYKWLEENPSLGKCFFLHDADIIFRKLPDFEKLLDDEVTYLSDTIGYIGYDYIISCCQRYESRYPECKKNQLLQEMVDVVGLTIEKVKENQNNSGGGQYILKNTTSELWYKIYSDCTPLYEQMLNFQNRFPINPGEIQFWTAEMWSLLWNLWRVGIDTKISSDLSFSWATDTTQIYEKHNILHMAGVTSDMSGSKFYKGQFININPLNKLKENINYFNYVDKNSATIKYVDVMKSLIKTDK